MKKILVTGGAGYIGSHTVVELIAAGYHPVIVDNFCNARKTSLEGIEKIAGKKVTFYEGDCTDKDFLRAVFKEEKDIDGAIHFAAIKAVGESVKKPLEYYANNLGCTVTLLAVMKEFGVSELVFSSSACVYGQPDVLPATEQTPIKQPESPYGNTKKICEEIIADVVKSGDPLKAVSLRYFNPIGAHPSAHIGELPLGIPNNLVPFVTQTAAGIIENLTVFGDDYQTPDGTCIRDYLHVVDLAKAHVKALVYIDQSAGDSLCDIFNLGTGQGASVMHIIKTFEKVNGLKLNYVIGPRRQGDVETLYADASKAREVLGWQTGLGLEQALEDAWRWQRTIMGN